MKEKFNILETEHSIKKYYESDHCRHSILTMPAINANSPSEIWKNRNAWIFSYNKLDTQYAPDKYQAEAEIADSNGEYTGRRIGRFATKSQCREAIIQHANELLTSTEQKMWRLHSTIQGDNETLGSQPVIELDPASATFFTELKSKMDEWDTLKITREGLKAFLQQTTPAASQ